MTRTNRNDAIAVGRVRRTGSGAHRAEPMVLRAGDTTVFYESASIRYVNIGGYEAIRRVYFALRNENWDTIDGTIHDEVVRATNDTFEVSFVSSHEQGDISFAWRATISGTSDGIVSFSFDGEALSSFRRNRIGLCILHPMDAAGRPCTVSHPDGTSEDSEFPELISPHQPFKAIRRIRHSVTRDIQCEVEFIGDVFEMEDQRNWTDGSFKIYSTPLDLPFPVHVSRGEKISQKVIIRPVILSKTVGKQRRRTARTERVTIEIDETTSVALPELGFQKSARLAEKGETAVERLRQLAPDHIRVDVRMSSQSEEEIEDLLRDAIHLGAPLELALFVPQERTQSLSQLAALLDKILPPLKRVLVFDEQRKVTSPDTLRQATSVLRPRFPDIEFCGGTDAFFAELNRDRPDMSLLDGLTYSINPQVHTFDNLSIVESLAAQCRTVESANAFSTGKPVHVSPVTFKMRWNPNATAPQRVISDERLSDQVDPRQLSLFAAAWTVGSIKSLAFGGAASATFYEAFGPRGLMEDEKPEIAPEIFPSIPGGIFPLYYMFLELMQYRGGRAVSAISSSPLVADALVVAKEGRTLLAIPNYSEYPLEVEIHGTGSNARIRYLDAESYDRNSSDPERYLQTTIERSVEGGRMELSLPANGVVFASY